MGGFARFSKAPAAETQPEPAASVDATAATTNDPSSTAASTTTTTTAKRRVTFDSDTKQHDADTKKQAAESPPPPQRPPTLLDADRFCFSSMSDHGGVGYDGLGGGVGGDVDMFGGVVFHGSAGDGGGMDDDNNNMIMTINDELALDNTSGDGIWPRPPRPPPRAGGGGGGGGISLFRGRQIPNEQQQQQTTATSMGATTTTATEESAATITLDSFSTPTPRPPPFGAPLNAQQPPMLPESSTLGASTPGIDSMIHKEQQQQQQNGGHDLFGDAGQSFLTAEKNPFASNPSSWQQQQDGQQLQNGSNLQGDDDNNQANGSSGMVSHSTFNNQQEDFQQEHSSEKESSGPPRPPPPPQMTTTTTTTATAATTDTTTADGIQPPRATGPFFNKQWQQPGGDNSTRPSFAFTKLHEEQPPQEQQPKPESANPKGEALVIMQPATAGGLAGQASFLNHHQQQQHQQQKMPMTLTKTAASTQNASSSNTTKMQQPTTKAPTRPGPNSAGLLLGGQNSTPKNMQQQKPTMVAATRPGPNAAFPTTTRNVVGAMQPHQQPPQSKNPPFHHGRNGMPTTTAKAPHANMQQGSNVDPNATGLAAFQTSTTNNKQTKDAPAAKDPSARSGSNGMAFAPTNALGRTTTTNNRQGQQPTITPTRPGGPKALQTNAQNSFARSANIQGAQQQPSTTNMAHASSVTPDARSSRASSSTTEQRGPSENSSIMGNRGTVTVGNAFTPKSVAGMTGVVSTLDGAGGGGGGTTVAADVSFHDLKNALLNELRGFDDDHEMYQEAMLNDHVTLGEWHAELLLMLAQETDLCEKIDEAISMADDVIRTNKLEDATTATSARPRAGPTTAE